MRPILLSLLLACAAIAAPPKAVPLDVSGGGVVMVVKSFPVVISAPPGGIDYTWFYPSSFDADEAGGKQLVINAAPKGTFKVRVKVMGRTGKPAPDDFAFDRGETVIVVGDGPGPTPPDPVPPDPKPPTPAGALRVLMVYETADLPKYDAGTQRVLFDMKVRGAMRDRCDKAGPDGRGWNIWDKDTDAGGAAAFWQSALKRPRASTPFIHVFKGDAPVFEGPLPKSAEEALALINKYAGE